jgi:FkbM family methyltransferase
MLNELNALEELNRTVSRLSEFHANSSQGRGIVICGGGTRYFPCAWVCINMLRRIGCKLPIELWHLGKKEMNDTMKSLVVPLNVRCVDAHERRITHPVRILNGWELKPYAILYSSFSKVLSLDADNVPIVDPSFLFDTPQFEETGAIFWPDFGRLASHRNIWRLTGIPYQDEPEFESGQLVVDKRRCLQALALTMWFNENSDFWYKHIHGDKETFHMAWRKLRQPFSMPSRGIHALTSTMCQHDFEGRRIFQHRNMSKWSIRGNHQIRGFEQEEACLEMLDELLPHWKEIAGVSIFHRSKKTNVELKLAEELISERWTYERIGHDKRNMLFLPDGTIGEGAAGLEIFWDICSHDAGNAFLNIFSPDSLTCKLFRAADGSWEGRWERFERMQIELRRIYAHEKRSHVNDQIQDFSQNGEQALVLDFFKNRDRGYFVDIGASDGVTHSNTRALYLRGWSGTFVEPVPEFFWRLENTYGKERVTLINAAIGDRDGFGEMWMVKQPKGGHEFADNRNTLDPSFAESVERFDGITYETREVRLMSAASLLKRIRRNQIDFLSVDAEGLDFEIVRDLLSAGLRFTLLLWESDKNEHKNQQLCNILSARNYKEAFRTSANQGWVLV